MYIFDNYSHEYKTRRTFALCIKSCYSQQNQENVPPEILEFMTSETANISSDNTNLIRNIFPDMDDDNSQPVPENVLTEGETTTTANQPQIFSSWEHSGSCFCYLEGRRKNKAGFNFNTDVNQTI